MKIVPTRDLVAADLPNLENPFVAAEKLRALIQSDRLGLPPALSRLTPFGARNPDPRPQELIRQLGNGELWLVHGVGDGKPVNPVLRWQEDNPQQGRWVVTASEAYFPLHDRVSSLNTNRIGPRQLARQGAGSLGLLPTENLALALQRRRHEETLQQTEAPGDSPLLSASTVASRPAATTTSESSPPQPAPDIHLEVGLFTDGTLNNADNSQALERRIEQECLAPFERGEISEAECRYRLGLEMGLSYTNAPSNIAKLADLYIESSNTVDDTIRHRFMAYAPGIGTKTGDGDSVMGMVTGMGDTGIESQVDRLFREVARRIFRLELQHTIASLQLDLFGFSRGAASARHAAHEINLGPEGALGQAFKAEDIEWPEHVNIRFIGLFDCVAAIINPANGDLSPGNHLNAPVNVYLNPDHVEQAVHLTAANEHRTNFALNSLRNADGSLPANFREISLPGVHSDIGGGYGDSQREDILISPLYPIPEDRARWPEQSMQWDTLERLKQQKEREGWIGDFSLPVRLSERLDPRPRGLGPEGMASLEIYQHASEHPGPSDRVELALRMLRQVRGEYSRVALRAMQTLAIKAGVPLDNIDPEDEATRLPADLKSIAETVVEQISAGAESPTLTLAQQRLVRQRYIHYSAHYNPFKFMALGTPTAFRLFRNFSPNAPTQNGERIVHPNR